VKEQTTGKLASRLDQHPSLKARTECAVPMRETDGSMIPIVERDEAAEDKRKNQHLSWAACRG
jgi:hypothetical protein